MKTLQLCAFLSKNGKASFSIADDGLSDNSHNVSKKTNKSCLAAKPSLRNLTEFFWKRQMDTEQQKTANERCLAYHAVQHSHCFRCIEFASKVTVTLILR